MTAAEEIRKRALALDVKDRVLLVESLLNSLPPVGSEWTEEEELAEAERREREFETGEVQALRDAELWQRVEVRRRK